MRGVVTVMVASVLFASCAFAAESDVVCTTSLVVPVMEEVAPIVSAPPLIRPVPLVDPAQLENRAQLSRERHTLESTLVISAVYAGAFAIMWNLPDDTTNWEKDEMFERFLDAFSNEPVWDNDEFITNWVLHPWWGMWVYQTQRNHGESMLRSFLIATAHSIAFEYVVEAWTEHPSIQDLLSTSPIGSLMGEISHRLIKRMGRDGFTRSERLLTDLLNPAYRWQIGFAPTR